MKDSEIKLIDRQEFHPNEAIAVKVNWLNPQHNEQVQLLWQQLSHLQPQKKQSLQEFKQNIFLNKEKAGIQFRLVHQKPLQQGTWRLSIKQEEHLIKEVEFQVSTQFKQVNRHNINPLQTLQVGLLNEHSGLTPKRQLLTTDSIGVKATWFCEDFDKSLTLVLVSPQGAGYPFNFTLSAGTCRWLKQYKPPQRLERGLWQVAIMDQEQLLGITEFRVQ